MLKHRLIFDEIHIKPSYNDGFLVDVGHGEFFVATTIKDLLDCLTQYLDLTKCNSQEP